MIQILTATNSGTYVIVQDQVSAVYAGDPEAIVDNLNTGAMFMETVGTDYIETQDLNLFLLE